MKVAIIGTGRVGSTTAFLLVENEKIDKLVLIDRTKDDAEGLKMDMMGTFSNFGDKLIIGDYEDADNADIILITCGSFGAPKGSNLLAVNKPIIEELFTKIKPKKEAKLVIITTPVDKTALIAYKLSGLDKNNVIGFGGQLDVNRLKYLIYSDKKDFSKNIDVHYVGEHGGRGIPIFREEVSNRNKIIEKTRKYFSLYLAKIDASTYGTAKELTKLVESLLGRERVLDVSYYDEKYGTFITWPCVVNENGVKEPIKLDLTDEEKKEFEQLAKKMYGETMQE